MKTDDTPKKLRPGEDVAPTANTKFSDRDDIAHEAAEALHIDELALDKECIQLPSHIFRFAKMAADLRNRADSRKRELEVVEADLSKKIRSDPASYGLEKVTESAIGSVVTTQPEYRKAYADLQKARYDLDIVQAASSAMEAKKRSLTLLVDLYGMSYFSSPPLSAKGQEAVQKMTKTALRPRRSAEQD